MGRPGGGGSRGGGGRIGGSRPSMRSGGGHRVGGGRPGGSTGRPGGGGGFNFGGTPGGGFHRNPPPPRPPRPPRRNGGFWKGLFWGSVLSNRRNTVGGMGSSTYTGGTTEYSSSYGSGNTAGGTGRYAAEPRISKGQIFLVVILVICAAWFGIRSSQSGTDREKLTGVAAYDSNCIVDEDYWFDNVSGTGKELKAFYNKTGVQPEIVIKALDADTEGLTDSQKENYAQEYFEEQGFAENTFLYMYFCENGDEVGFMCYVNGRQVDPIMDADAIEIFWNKLDKYWYSDMSSDELFTKTFNETADQIMKSTGCGMGLALTFAVMAVVLAVIFGAIYAVRLAAYKNMFED